MLLFPAKIARSSGTEIIRKRQEDLFGMKVKVTRPEDSILMKLRWADLSGGSEKQFIDALRVYEVQFKNLDMAYIDAWAKTLSVIPSRAKRRCCTKLSQL